ncbi:MAG TPA: hypothetical protein VGG89_07570 [Candidatus Baltobacteraceae bacterium]|jgi:hypothetical protein
MRFTGGSYKPLCPSIAMLKMDSGTFDAAYAAQFALLDPRQTHDDLVTLAAGYEPILLC